MRFERDDCFKETGRPKDGNAMFKCRLGGTYRGRPCISDNKGTYMKDVPFTKAVKGFDDPNQKHLRKLFSLLGHKNGSFLMFGDSVTVQFTQAFTCEMERTKLVPMLYDMWTPNVYPFGRSKKVTSKVGARRNVVPFNHITLNRGGRATVNRIKNYVTNMFLTTDVIAVAFNHGVWYNDGAWDSDSRRFYVSDMKEVFGAFHSLAVNYPDKNISVSWMETQAQHFNSSLHNPSGYFSGYIEPNPRKQKKKGPPVKNYFCDRIQNTSDAADWRNDYMWKQVLPWAERRYKNVHNLHLSVVHMRDLTVPLHNMHMHTDNVDCTHFCFTPMMYQPVFYELWEAALKL